MKGTLLGRMPPRAILFDMDGVLVRSERIWARVVEQAGVRFRGRPVTLAEFLPTFGQGTAADVSVFGLACTPEELDAFYFEHFGRCASDVWIHPEAQALLRSLRARGLALAVVTNTATALARQVLDAAGLTASLDFIACADQVAHGKPAPDVVLHALRALGVEAKDAWMVGDSRYDREAAAAAGVYFVGLGLDGDARLDALEALSQLLQRGSA